MYPYCPCVSGDMCSIINVCVLIHRLYSLFPHAFVRFELCSRSLSCTRTYLCKYIKVPIYLKLSHLEMCEIYFTCTVTQMSHGAFSAYVMCMCWPSTMNYTAVHCDHDVLISIHTHTLSSAHVSAVHCACSQCLFPPFPRLRG